MQSSACTDQVFTC